MQNRGFGWALLLCGLTFAVCRYAFLPLSLPGPWSPVLVAVPASLFVLGVQVLRRGTPSPTAPRTWLAMAIVLVGIVAGFALAGRMMASIPCEPKAVELPGIRVELCDWTVMESSGDWHLGRYRLQSPRGRGRFVGMNWAASEPTDVETTIQLFMDLIPDAQSRVLSRSQVSIHGHAGHRVHIDFAGRLLRFSTWHCEQDGRDIRIETFLEGDAEAIDALHASAVESVRCHAEAPPKPVFPELTVPDGYERTEYRSHVWLEGREGIFSISMGIREPKLMTELRAQERLRKALVQNELELEEVQIGSSEQLMGDKSTWRGTATMSGDPVEVQLTAFACAGGLSFVVVFAGADTQRSTVQRLVEGMRCPETSP